MTRFLVVPMLAAAGFVVLTPVQAQSDAAVPEAFVASEGTVLAVPPGLGTAASSTAAGSTDPTWTERPTGTAKGPTERQLSGPAFREGNLGRNAGPSATSVAPALRQADRAAGCNGCSTERQARAEHNSGSAWHVVPYEFINPFTLGRSRSPTFSTEGTRTITELPRLSDSKQSQPAESSPIRSANRSEEKRFDAASAKDPSGAPGRSEEKRSATTGSSQVAVASANVPEKKSQHGLERASEKAAATFSRTEGKPAAALSAASNKAAVASSRAQGKPAAALAAPSIPSPLGNGGGGVGKVPEPETWILTLLGLLGASLLRRRSRRGCFLQRGHGFAAAA